MEERFQVFTVLIAGINRSILRIKTEEMSEFNLRSSHVSCLYYLYKKESLTAREICNLCGEDKANISRAVKLPIKVGIVAITARKIAPTKVILDITLFRYSTVGLPGLIPGINPPFAFIFSATSTGLKVIAV